MTEPRRRCFDKLVCVVSISSILILPGCSLFVGSTQSIAITATDPAAEISVDGQPVGRGSAVVDLRRNRTHGILARVGDRVGAAQLGTEISTTGVLDIIGGVLFLIPFLGLLGPGFWSLDQDHVNVSVPPPPIPSSPLPRNPSKDGGRS